jgi:hypothetical protein
MHDESKGNGQRVTDFAISMNMKINSTFFQRKKIYKETWTSPDGASRNQIDHVMIYKRHSSDTVNVRICRGADCDSSHFLVRIRYKQKLSRKKGKQGEKRVRYETKSSRKRK